MKTKIINLFIKVGNILMCKHQYELLHRITIPVKDSRGTVYLWVWKCTKCGWIKTKIE